MSLMAIMTMQSGSLLVSHKQFVIMDGAIRMAMPIFMNKYEFVQL